MGSLGGSISSSTCSPISAHFSYVNPTHFHLTGPSGPSSLSESRVPVLSPIYPPTPSSSTHFPPHPHLHPLHPLNHPIHHRLPLPIHIQNGQNCLVQVLPHPKAQMFNGQQEYLPQLMPLHPAMIPSLHPIFQQTPYAISSAFKPYLTQTPNPTNNQNFFYFPPTPTESHADSEDDKSQASSESEIIPQMDCPKLEAQPSMSLEDEDLDEPPPILTPPPELNRECEMEIDLPSIKSEIIDPKWDLPKPIPQKNQLIISVESIEPTPPVTPEEVEEKEEKDEMKDTISESGNSIPSIEEITQEFEEEKTKIGKVIVITRIEEEIREKVADVEQRKEPESSSKRAHSKDRKSLPLKRRKALEMSDYDGKCQWADCGHGSEGTNQLYDHVINEHIVPLSTFCSATPSTSGISSQSREGSVSSEISLKQILRKRRSSPVQCSDQGIDSDSDEIDPLGCQWADCEMCLTRGDSDRKYQWLRDHFRTRHAKGAQTYKCILEGCNARFHTNRQLEDHVRLTHIQPANANSHRKDRKSGDIWKKMLKELPSDFPLGKNPYYSSFHHAQLVGHARRLEKCRSGVMLEFKSKKSAHGSAWRKIKIFSQPRLSIVYENSSVFKVPQMPIKSEMNEEKVDERSLSSADFKQRLYALKPSAVLLSLDDLFNA